jgi:hypothetical protein
MDIAAVEAEISNLLSQMQNRPEDAHELYLQITEKLNELRAFGLPLPADLVELEQALAEDWAKSRRLST